MPKQHPVRSDILPLSGRINAKQHTHPVMKKYDDLHTKRVPMKAKNEREITKKPNATHKGEPDFCE